MGNIFVLRELSAGGSFPLHFTCTGEYGEEITASRVHDVHPLQHAFITGNDDHVCIENPGSYDEVRVNDRKIEDRVVLNPGDHVQLGRMKFTVSESRGSTDEQVFMVNAIDRQAQSAMDHRRLSVIYEIASGLSGSNSMDSLGRKIFPQLKNIFAHDRGYIALFEKDGTLKPLLTDPPFVSVPMLWHIVSRVFQNGESFLIQDMDPGIDNGHIPAQGNDEPGIKSPPSSNSCHEARPGELPEGSLSDTGEGIAAHSIMSAMCVPLIYHNQIYGLIYLSRMAEDAYSLDDLEFLKGIASMIAPLIENARLIAEIRDLSNQTVVALRKAETRLVETEHTAAHVRLAQAMAHELRNPLMLIGGMVRKIARMNPEIRTSDTYQVLVSSMERMELALKDVDDLIRTPVPHPRLQRIDKLLRSEIAKYDPYWQKMSICPVLAIRTPYVMLPVDQELLMKAFSMVFQEIHGIIPQGSILPIEVLDRGSEIEIAIGEVGSRDHFCDLYDPKVESKPWIMSLLLSIAHKIFIDHGGKLLFDAEAHSAFPIIIRVPRLNNQQNT